MIVYRIAKDNCTTDLSGQGARLAGGRWNYPGNAVIYTASSPSLCLLELMIHLPSGQLPPHFSLVTLDIPDLIIRQIPLEQLPAGWNSYPVKNITMQKGDAIFLENLAPVLSVPSAIVPEERNYILFPHHPDFKDVRIVAVTPLSTDN